MEKTSKLSIPFIENRGQVDKEVAYYAKTFGGQLFITKYGELVYSLHKYEEKAEREGGLSHRESDALFTAR